MNHVVVLEEEWDLDRRVWREKPTIEGCEAMRPEAGPSWSLYYEDIVSTGQAMCVVGI